jgi:hypothetical protein
MLILYISTINMGLRYWGVYSFGKTYWRKKNQYCKSKQNLFWFCRKLNISVQLFGFYISLNVKFFNDNIF